LGHTIYNERCNFITSTTEKGGEKSEKEQGFI
jgi:hypothetical protein